MLCIADFVQGRYAPILNYKSNDHNKIRNFLLERWERISFGLSEDIVVWFEFYFTN